MMVTILCSSDDDEGDINGMEVFVKRVFNFVSITSSGSVGISSARPPSASVCHFIDITESLKTYFNVFGYIVLLYVIPSSLPPTPNTLHESV